MLSIDVNCDMGESYGAWTVGKDALLMDYVSSVNIACGFHAGDPSVMHKTLAMAAEKKLNIGAHPGFPDLQGFGRRQMDLTLQEVYDIIVYQISALSGFARVHGASLRHVKPHGALYNIAAVQPELAASVAQAVYDVDKRLILVGLSGSFLIREASRIGLQTASEVFADRTYQPNGTLTPRSSPGAMIENPHDAAEQVLHMVLNQAVIALSGEKVPVKAETVCVHGDGNHALEIAKYIVELLKQNHVAVKPL
jgi:5-oxoprolinase (ATP-hydrolysing) subunit A